MLGYCMICDRLTTIRPGSQKWGSRERRYYPVSHDHVAHVGCGEFVERVDIDDIVGGPADLDQVCRKCGWVEPQDTAHVRCLGDKKEIK